MSHIRAPSAEDVKKRLRPFGIFFEKSLKDLVKGIRSHNETPEQLHEFLNHAIEECRNEVNSPDFNLKTNAILKLTYLEMYGYDMSWANFHILEVMSSSKFQQKRVGYLAASQSFYKDSDILMLATNLLKKDLKYDFRNDTVKIAVALSGLSTIVTPELARDICDDLFLMLNSGKPYIRKKAVTALFKVFLQYPESLRDGLEKLVARLEDEDTSVVSATVTVICELVKYNPHPFIQFSPLLYEMLIQVDNNWIIIRLLKLFSNLSKVEPKLRYKLLPKILELMDKTSAASVIYEAINCIVKGQLLEDDDFDTAVQCLQHLETFVNSLDPNLRYISCVLFYEIGKINVNFISQFDELVIDLLCDVDVSIRSKVLELCPGIASSKNIRTIVKMLVRQFVEVDTVQVNDQGVEIEIPNSYKVKVVHTVLDVCTSNNFSNINNEFEWLVGILGDLCILAQDLNERDLGQILGENFRDLMIKVPTMRETALEQLIKLTSNDDIISKIPDLLRESIWCFGEYSGLIYNSDDLISVLIKKSEGYPEKIITILIPALMKLLSSWLNTSNHTMDEVSRVLGDLIKFMEKHYYSRNFEVQERSTEFFEFLKLCQESMEGAENDSTNLPLLLTDILPSFFNGYELEPIAQGQQELLLESTMTDLETPFLTPEDLTEILDKEEEFSEELASYGGETSKHDVYNSSDEEPPQSDTNDYHSMNEEEKKRAEERKKQERLDNPFYLAAEEEEPEARLLEFSDIEEPKTEGPVIKITHNPDIKRHHTIKIITEDLNGDHQPKGKKLSKKNGQPSKNAINLTLSNKLQSFDFSKSKDNEDEYLVDNYEIEKLRNKFSEQSLEVNTPLHDGEEEIIVIKKKKKKSKDNKDKKKVKKKPKKSVPVAEASSL